MRQLRFGPDVAAMIFCAEIICGGLHVQAQVVEPKFKVVAFYTGRSDQAHISFVREANRWFPEKAARYGFAYESTTNWSQLTTEFLGRYQVVLFLDTRPEDTAQRKAFQNYMEQGGGWMGF